MTKNYIDKFTFLSLVIIALVVFSCDRVPPNPPKPTPKPTPQPTESPPIVTPSVMEEVYAPTLFFDSGEKDPLTTVEAFMQVGPTLQGRKGIKRYKIIKEKPTLEDLAQNTSKKVKIDGDEYELMLQTKAQVSRYEGVVYTRKLQKNDFTYIQYWFFYSFNDTSSLGGNAITRKCGNHQADWEHISLKINTAKFEAAKDDEGYLKAIEELYFSQHGKGQNDERKFRKTKDKEVHFEGTHVKAYPARGSHATYYEPHKGPGYLLIKTLGLYDHADGKGIALKSQGHLIDLPSQPWSKYAGRWGEISDDICNLAEWFSDASNDGPPGPIQQLPGSDWDMQPKP